MSRRNPQISTLSEAFKMPGPKVESKLKYALYSIAGAQGLYLAVWAHGTRIFQFNMKRKGVRYFMTLGPLGEITLDDAVQTARKYRQMVQDGLDPRLERASSKRKTVGEFVEESFWPDVGCRYKSSKNVRNMLDKRILPAFGDLPLKQIDKRMIRKFSLQILDEINSRTGQKVGEATANRTVALLSSVFKYALELDYVEVNPCSGVRALREKPSRSRFLSDSEYVRYGRAAFDFIEHYHAKILVMAMALGVRPGEIKGLAWKNVFLQERLLYLEDTKNGESRYVPFGDIVAGILGELNENRPDSPWVFPARSESGHTEDLRGMHKKICDRARISDFQIRDLRRSHATMLRQSGQVDLLTVKEVLGHKSLTSTLVYARVPSSDMVAANKLADKVFQRKVLSQSSSDGAVPVVEFTHKSKMIASDKGLEASNV